MRTGARYTGVFLFPAPLCSCGSCFVAVGYSLGEVVAIFDLTFIPVGLMAQPVFIHPEVVS